MEKLRTFIAVVVGLVGFLAGFGVGDTFYSVCYTSGTSTMILVSVCAFLALVLGTSAWKLRKEMFSYVVLLATSGTAGVSAGLAVIAFILD